MAQCGGSVLVDAGLQQDAERQCYTHDARQREIIQSTYSGDVSRSYARVETRGRRDDH